MSTKPLEPASDARVVRPVAVIDIGTSALRMAIAEIDNRGSVHKLASLTQAVSLGKDTFTLGYIRKSTIEECVRVLKSYRQVLREHQVVQADQIRVVATSAVREAKNRLAFIDRIYIATGLQVQPIDEAEENRVTYLSVLPFLHSEAALAVAKTLVIEVGGGSTDLLVVRNTNVLSAHSYRLGSLRLRETLEAYHAPVRKVRAIMTSQIDRVVHQIQEQVSANGAVEMIALGGDVRFAASQLLPDWNPQQLGRVAVGALEEFTQQVIRRSEDELVNKYHLSFADADTLGPALLTYVQLARAFQLVNILVTSINLRDGLLKEMAVGAHWTDEFSNQIIRSAIALGQRYDFDEPHARHVAQLAQQLFQELQAEHQLEQRYAILLYVAALLHEIGLYVSLQSHHKHSMYLIKNSDVFGLSRRDLLLASMVARYYRRASPQPTHEGYSSLDRDARVAVAKMAGLLRVAVALDDSRSQRIKTIKCRREDNRLIIGVPGVEDLALEQLALRQSGSLFEETFGLQVLLRTARGTPE
jgi:exopolyphosphatase/guanosine-5'-triphosphate,3'-diphosphate pyrophosphatase